MQTEHRPSQTREGQLKRPREDADHQQEAPAPPVQFISEFFSKMVLFSEDLQANLETSDSKIPSCGRFDMS